MKWEDRYWELVAKMSIILGSNDFKFERSFVYDHAEETYRMMKK